MIKLLFFLLMSITTFQDFIEHEKFVKTDIPELNNFLFYEYNDEIFYLDKYEACSPDKDSLKIYSVNHLDLKYIIKIPKDRNTTWGFKSFAINEQYIALIAQKGCYIYEKVNNKFEYKTLVNFFNDQSFQKLWLKNDSIIFFDDMVYSSKVKKNKDIVFGKYSIKDSVFTYKGITDIDYIMMANNFPRKIVDFDIDGDRAFVSDIMNYKIRIYKYNTLIDSIVLKKSFWVNELDSINACIPEDPEVATMMMKTNLIRLMKLGLNRYQIVSINYINKDKLLIVWNGSALDKENANLHIDTWDISKKPYKCILENVKFFRDFNKEPLVKENNIIYGNSFEIFPSGRIVYPSYDPVNISEPKFQNMIFKDYKIYKDSLLEAQEDLKATLNIFRMKI